MGLGFFTGRRVVFFFSGWIGGKELKSRYLSKLVSKVSLSISALIALQIFFAVFKFGLSNQVKYKACSVDRYGGSEV